MEKGTIYVALDDSKRKLVIAMLWPGATEPKEQEIPKDAQHIQRLGDSDAKAPCKRATRRASPGTTSTARSRRAT